MLKFARECPHDLRTGKRSCNASSRLHVLSRSAVISGGECGEVTENVKVCEEASQVERERAYEGWLGGNQGGASVFRGEIAGGPPGPARHRAQQGEEAGERLPRRDCRKPSRSSSPSSPTR